MKQHKFGHKRSLLIVMIAMFVQACFSAYQNVLMGEVTDLAMAADIDGVIKIAKVVVGMGIVYFVVNMIGVQLEKNYIKNTLVDIKSDYLGTMVRLNPIKLYTMQYSKYTSNLTNDMDRLEHQYYLHVITLSNMILNLIVSIIVLITIWWGFILIAIFLGSVFLYMARKTSEPVKKEEKKKSSALSAYTGFVEESLQGFEIITQHQLEKQRHQRFESLTQDLKTQQYQVEKKITLVDAFNGLIQNIMIGLLIVLGLLTSRSMGLTFGNTIVVIMLFSNLIGPLTRLTPIITEMNAISTLFGEFNANLQDDGRIGTKSVTEFEGFEFESASLGYDTPILRDVNFKIEPKDKVLIVGPSGAGKSTLLKTLLRQIDPLDGALRLNNKNVQDLKLTEYYHLMSIVDQIGFIFSGTVQENISLLDNKTTKEILKKVSLGYLDESLLLKNDGSNLSGGERARLLLARAYYFDKDIVLCDEILSSLDKSVARQIEQDILSSEKTIVNISHIVFPENLDSYNKYVIVDQGTARITENKDEILSRMLEYEMIVA